MGYTRFRNSIKVCKGVHINLNKDSVGLSVGVPGLGYTVNSKGRQTTHVGIPGTGLSYISTLPNNSNVQTNSKELNDYNKTNEELININRLCTERILTEADYNNSLNNLKMEKYESKNFDQPEPTIDDTKKDLLEKAKKDIKSVAFWTLKKKQSEYVDSKYEDLFKTRHDYWLKEKEEFEREEKKIESDKNKKFLEEFEKQKESLNKCIEGDEEFVRLCIDSWFNSLEFPFECNINYEYEKNKKKVLIDLDLPEIEDFPPQKAVKLANGSIKLQDKTKTELNTDYKKYVFGLALFIVSNIFNKSPNIKMIVISGYTQRRNSAGRIQNDYVYSIRFDRERLSKMDLKTMDPFMLCMSFENACLLDTKNSLKRIEPFDE